MVSKAISAAVDHLKSLGLRHVDVPEWLVEGKPLRIYYKPLTLTERDAISAGDAGMSDAEVVYYKALDEREKRLFGLEDKVLLKIAVSFHVLHRIALAMLSAQSVGDAEKNSGAIQT